MIRFLSVKQLVVVVVRLMHGSIECRKAKLSLTALVRVARRTGQLSDSTQPAVLAWQDERRHYLHLFRRMRSTSWTSCIKERGHCRRSHSTRYLAAVVLYLPTVMPRLSIGTMITKLTVIGQPRLVLFHSSSLECLLAGISEC